MKNVAVRYKWRRSILERRAEFDSREEMQAWVRLHFTEFAYCAEVPRYELAWDWRAHHVNLGT